MRLVNVASQVPLAMEIATKQHIEEKESLLNFKVFSSMVSSDWTDFLVARSPHHLILVQE